RVRVGVGDEREPDCVFPSSIGTQGQQVQQDPSGPLTDLTPPRNVSEALLHLRRCPFHGVTNHLGASREVVLHRSSADPRLGGYSPHADPRNPFSSNDSGEGVGQSASAISCLSHTNIIQS